ncbi:hypothetical protein HJFPF1_09468 [Paramyrothecium foliicola]|nr:hypothetical protein HJFPF1_09468 [Paramyrothecium foliicola]
MLVALGPSAPPPPPPPPPPGGAPSGPPLPPDRRLRWLQFVRAALELEAAVLWFAACSDDVEALALAGAPAAEMAAAVARLNQASAAKRPLMDEFARAWARLLVTFI